MKYTINFLLAFVTVVLFGCSGSDTYRGLWKAMNSKGEKVEINFDAKSFSIKDSAGKTTSYDYTQNHVSIENSVETYGIEISDGRHYMINFPIAADETKGVIRDGNGYLLYTIGRKDFITTEELYKLQ